MGRGATIASNNVYYQARIEKAKVDDRYASRAGASEAIGNGISEEMIKNLELNLNKNNPVDVVLYLADAYNAPNLCFHHCKVDCPIGRMLSISDEVKSIDRVTVKLLKNLKVNELSEIKDKLLDIAEDGIITEDEKPDLKEVVEYLDKISVTISELKILSEKVLRGGQMDG